MLSGPASVKAVWKMLMKLSPGVNFINILRTAFALSDPKSIKNTVDSSVSFYAFGIYKVKSARRMLMKLSPGAIVQIAN